MSETASERAWFDWARRFEQAMTQRVRMDDLRALSAQADALPDPIPERFEWARGYDGAARGSGGPLAMLVGVGDLCSYHDQHNAGARAVVEDLGRRLIARGASLGPEIVNSALRFGLAARTLDSLERLLLCQAWRAERAMDGQLALATCARHAKWHTTGSGVACWEKLIEMGAMSDCDWSGCSRERQPALSALQDLDWAGFKRAAQAGVSLDWIDPDTGATLWHMLGVGGFAMAKAALPLLREKAPHLALLKTRAALDFGQDAWSYREGSTPWKCASGSSALSLAVKDLESAVTLAALALGANPNEADEAGNAPLHLLAKRHGAKAEVKALALAQALLDAGADPSLPNAKGLTPLQLMAAKAPTSAIAALLESRPQDIGGESAAQKQAFERLSSRGSEGLSLAERAALRSVSPEASPAAAPRPKSRL